MKRRLQFGFKHSRRRRVVKPSSVALESITLTVGAVLVEFMAHPGIAYRLQARNNLANGNWRTVGRLDPKPSAGLVRLPEFLPTPQPNRYYRIEVRKP